MKNELISKIKWREDGLMPAICQDISTGQILMMAWVNSESLSLTLEKKRVHFWSRSRKKIWEKGETSGNFLNLESVSLDCDLDCILFFVSPKGPACHTNRMSCFFNEIFPKEVPEQFLYNHNFLESIYKLIEERKNTGNLDESYVARLFSKGKGRIAKKVGEEASEVVIALMDSERNEIIEEMGDLWFHLLVAMVASEIPPGEILSKLAERFSKGGRSESER